MLTIAACAAIAIAGCAARLTTVGNDREAAATTKKPVASPRAHRRSASSRSKTRVEGAREAEGDSVTVPYVGVNYKSGRIRLPMAETNSFTSPPAPAK
jgi:hypothetical protein